jgi:hypothetical protein
VAKVPYRGVMTSAQGHRHATPTPKSQRGPRRGRFVVGEAGSVGERKEMAPFLVTHLAARKKAIE